MRLGRARRRAGSPAARGRRAGRRGSSAPVSCVRSGMTSVHSSTTSPASGAPAAGGAGGRLHDERQPPARIGCCGVAGRPTQRSPARRGSWATRRRSGCGLPRRLGVEQRGLQPRRRRRGRARRAAATSPPRAGRRPAASVLSASEATNSAAGGRRHARQQPEAVAEHGGDARRCRWSPPRPRRCGGRAPRARRARPPAARVTPSLAARASAARSAAACRRRAPPPAACARPAARAVAIAARAARSAASMPGSVVRPGSARSRASSGRAPSSSSRTARASSRNSASPSWSRRPRRVALQHQLRRASAHAAAARGEAVEQRLLDLRRARGPAGRRHGERVERGQPEHAEVGRGGVTVVAEV